MISHELKINHSNLKSEIEGNYFYWLDVFHRCLVVSLVTFDSKEDIISSTVLENAHYNQLLRDMSDRHIRGKNILEEINSKANLATFLDINLYLEDFIGTKHKPPGTHIYHLTIDHEYNVVVTIKRIGKVYAF